MLTEPVPAYGTSIPVRPGIHRIVAPNPGVMTYHGTNTYLVEDAAGRLTVIDPGPLVDSHVAAVIAAGAGRISRILVSHFHFDHAEAAYTLRDATGATLHGHLPSGGPDFAADHHLADNAKLGDFTAIFTPGHADDHLCFAWNDGVVFTADHVMGWASTVVPPDGMVAYFASLRRLLAQPAGVLLSGHGPPILTPHAHVQGLLEHRFRREAEIERAVAATPQDSRALLDLLYQGLNPALRQAAECNVVSHLRKLASEGRVGVQDGIWHATPPD